MPTIGRARLPNGRIASAEEKDFDWSNVGYTDMRADLSDVACGASGLSEVGAVANDKPRFAELMQVTSLVGGYRAKAFVQSLRRFRSPPPPSLRRGSPRPTSKPSQTGTPASQFETINERTGSPKATKTRRKQRIVR
jgi:hypothetical protein